MTMELNHAPNTIVISVTGSNTDIVDYDLVLKVLRLHANIYSDHILTLYSSGKKHVWYLTLKHYANTRLYNKLHGTQYHFHDGNILFTFKHLDKKYVWASLHWVPLLFFKADVQEIVESISRPFTEVFVKNELDGRWTICFIPADVNRIPHYINVKFGIDNRHTVLLVLPGRDPVCYICGEVGHTTAVCPDKTQPAVEHQEMNSTFFPVEEMLSETYGYANANPVTKNMCFVGEDPESVTWTEGEIDTMAAMPPSWSLNPKEIWYIDKFKMDVNKLEIPPTLPKKYNKSETRSVTQTENAAELSLDQRLKKAKKKRNHLQRLKAALDLALMTPLLQELSTDLDSPKTLNNENKQKNIIHEELIEELKNLGISESSIASLKKYHSKLFTRDANIKKTKSSKPAVTSVKNSQSPLFDYDTKFKNVGISKPTFASVQNSQSLVACDTKFKNIGLSKPTEASVKKSQSTLFTCDRTNDTTKLAVRQPNAASLQKSQSALFACNREINNLPVSLSSSASVKNSQSSFFICDTGFNNAATSKPGGAPTQKPHSMFSCDTTISDSDSWESSDNKFKLIETVADIEHQPPPFNNYDANSSKDLVTPSALMKKEKTTAITYSEEAKQAAYKRLLPFMLSKEEISKINLLETTYEDVPDTTTRCRHKPVKRVTFAPAEENPLKPINIVFRAFDKGVSTVLELAEKKFNFKPLEKFKKT